MKITRINFYYGILKGSLPIVKPNFVHKWLSNKNLITQNIDGLDAKAGNKNYISIHGRLDKVIIYQDEMEYQTPIDANWNEIDPSQDDNKVSHLYLINLKF